MQTRTVTGLVRRGSGQPWADAKVHFYLEGTYTTDTVFPPDRVEVVTNEQGEYSATLFCNSEALTPARWRCVEPGSDPFFFTLVPGGTPISIIMLRAAGDAPLSPDDPAYAVLQDALEVGDAETLEAAKAYTDEQAPDLSNYQPRSERNQPGGYAGLDAGGLVPDVRLPSTIARDSEVTAAVGAEAAARTSADAALQVNIGAEASARADADSAINAALALIPSTYAPLVSAALTGGPTAPTLDAANSSTAIATTAFVHAVATAILGAPPSTLDTLTELASALGNDPNFAATITTLIGTKLSKSANLTDLTNPAAARAALALVIGTHVQAYSAALAQIAALAPNNGDILQLVAGLWTNRTPAQFKTDLVLAKADVGLPNVDNTSDANKPVSTAQQTALDAKANQSALTSHTGNVANPHAVTKAQVGLSNVTNNPQLVSINGDTTQAQTVVGADDIAVATTGGATTVRRQARSGGPAGWMFPFGNFYNATTGLISSANQVRVARLYLPMRLTVASIHFHISTAFAGGLCSVGVYSDDGTTLLIDSGAKSTTATGVVSTTLAATVTLGPGWYWVAYTCDNATSAISGTPASANPSAVLNAGTGQVGAAANASAAGVLPATLGTVTSSNVVGAVYVKVQG